MGHDFEDKTSLETLILKRRIADDYLRANVYYETLNVKRISQEPKYPVDTISTLPIQLVHAPRPLKQKLGTYIITYVCFSALRFNVQPWRSPQLVHGSDPHHDL